MTGSTTHTLDVPGAVLAYDVRDASTPDGDVLPAVERDATATRDGDRPLLVIGSPMAASGFGTLTSYFADRTVVTYDPRGAERSRRTDGADRTTPQEHAEDLHAVIAAVGGGPVDVFASSGGAVNALALVAAYPDDVATLVAHEPPLAQLVPDRSQALAASQAVHDTYLKSGFGAAMARFIALVGFEGPLPQDPDDPRLAPDPAAFGLPGEDDGSRDDVLLGQNLISCTHFEPDLDALIAAPTRIVVAVGEKSEGQLAHRGALALAERLGTAPVAFPGDHGGFMGAENPQGTGEPEAFAAALRHALG